MPNIFRDYLFWDNLQGQMKKNSQAALKYLSRLSAERCVESNTHQKGGRLKPCTKDLCSIKEGH